MAGAVIAQVLPGSIAWELGVSPGSQVLRVNGRRIRDVIDFRFEATGPATRIEVLDPSGTITVYEVEKDYDDLLGIEFQDVVFDGIRECANACPFCFVRNLPAGLRQTLYVRDDDFRLSFLYGNFITLTNLREPDLRRIILQRLSPLYVSVHATNPELRQKMFGNKRAARLLPLVERLVAQGVRFHFQIVLCPGLNDGDELRRSLHDLLALGESVLSVGVVPVGLTRYCPVRGLRPLSQREAAEAIHIVQAARTKDNRNPVFASDELFILAGQQIPQDSYYADYPQLENGIGLARLFLDEAASLPELPHRVLRPKTIAIITGESWSPFMADFVNRYHSVEGLEVLLKTVKNDFFGETVTVAGLLVGDDIEKAISHMAVKFDEVLIPETCQNNGRFIDGVTIEEISGKLGTRITPVPISPRLIDERIVS